MCKKIKIFQLSIISFVIVLLFTSCNLCGSLIWISFLEGTNNPSISTLSDGRFNGSFKKNYEGKNYNWWSASYDYYKVVEETYTFDNSNKVKLEVTKRLYRLNEDDENIRPNEDHYIRTVHSSIFQEFQIKDNNKYRLRTWESFCKPTDFCDWLKYEFNDNDETLHLYLTIDEEPLDSNYAAYTKDK